MTHKTPCGDAVALSLFCNGLKNVDWGSKSDPFIAMFFNMDTVEPALAHAMRSYRKESLSTTNKTMQSAVEDGNDGWLFFGRTETVWDCLSPSFLYKFMLPVLPANIDKPSTLHVRFEVFDDFRDSEITGKPRLIGAAECCLEDIISDGVTRVKLCNHKMEQHERDPDRYGTLTVAADTYSIPSSREPINLRVDCTSNSRVPPALQLLFVMYRRVHSPASGETLWTPIAQGGPKQWTDSSTVFQFQEQTIEQHSFTAGDPSRQLCMKLFIYHDKGKHILVGFSDSFALEDVQRDRMIYTFHSEPTSGKLLRSGSAQVELHYSSKSRETDSAISSILALSQGLTGALPVHMEDSNALLVITLRSLAWRQSSGGISLRKIVPW